MKNDIETEDNHMLKFKQSISLEDMSNAMKYFSKLYQIFAGRDAVYTEFTNWLIDSEFVDVEPNLKDLEKMMAAKK